MAKGISKGISRAIRLYAQYPILRSAYVTVMLTMPDELGPDLEDTEAVTALAYLACNFQRMNNTTLFII